VVGTLEYMSPERIRGLEADARSDLYSVGIVLYELLTGHAPFQGNSDYELMRAQVEAPPLPPRAWAPNLPEGVERIILRALQKAPEDRYQSAWEMREALRATGLTPLLRLRVSEPSGERKASDEVTEKLTPSGRRTVPLVGPVADRIMEPAIPALFSQGEKPPAAVQDERPAVAAQDERLAAAAVQDEMHPVAAVQDEMLAAPPAAVPTPEPEAPPMEMGALPTETDAPPEMELEIPPSLAKYVPYLEAARRDAEAELIPPPSLAADAPPELAAGAALEKSPTPSAERPAALYQHEHAASRSATTAPGLTWKYYLGVAAGLAAGLAIVALALFVLLRPETAQKPATAPTPSPSIDAATGAAPLPSASPTVQAADSPPPTEKAGVGKEAPKPKPGQSAEAREKERRRREILKALQEKDNR
jgi:serine/threonine-protein kinase